MAAVRWGVFAEGGVKLLAAARQAAAVAVPPSGSDMKAVADALRLRLDGANEVKRLTAILFPEEDHDV